MDGKDSGPRRSERQEQRRASGGSSGEDRGASSQGEDQGGGAPATPHGGRGKSGGRKKSQEKPEEVPQEANKALDAGSSGGQASRNSPKTVKFDVSDTERTVDINSRSVRQLDLSSENPFLQDTPENRAARSAAEEKDSSEEQQKQEQQRQFEQEQEQALAAYQAQQMQNSSLFLGGQTQERELQEQQDQALLAYQSSFRSQQAQEITTSVPTVFPTQYFHHQPHKTSEDQQTARGGEHPFVHTSTSQGQTPREDLNAISCEALRNQHDKQNSQLPEHWISFYDRQRGVLLYHNVATNQTTETFADVINSTARHQHFPQAQPQHYDAGYNHQRPQQGMPSTYQSMTQAPSSVMIDPQVQLRLQHLQEQSRLSNLASEQTLRDRQKQPLSDVTFVQNQLRDDLLRVLVGHDLTRQVQTPWLEDPLFQQAVGRHLQLERLAGVMGSDLLQERLAPRPSFNLPPYNSPHTPVGLGQASQELEHQHILQSQGTTIPRASGGQHAQERAFLPNPSQEKHVETTHASRNVRTHAASGPSHASGNVGTHASGNVGTHASDESEPPKPQTPKRTKDQPVKRQDPQALSNLERCPRCGLLNRQIRGDPVLHYMDCKKTQRGFTPSTDELVALRNLEKMRRRLKGITERSDAIEHEEKEEARARKSGTRQLKDESSRSESSESGVERNEDGYEDDSGDDDSSVSSSHGSASAESSASSVARSPKKPKPNKRNLKSDHHSQTKPESSEIKAMRAKLDDFQHQQNDMAACVKQIFSQLQVLSESRSQQQQSVRSPSVVNVSSSVSGESSSPSHQRVDQRMGGGGAAFHQGGEDNVGDQAYPEIEDKDLAVMSSFEKHKKAYREYVSKCRDRGRTAVPLAATFAKWGEWLAVVFTEQDKQKSETEGRGSWNKFERRHIVAMENPEFEARYSEMCGLTLKEPSSVLDFLRTVEVDVSEGGSMPQLLMAAESFRSKLKTIPAKALHATSADRIRNAFLESLFGEDRGKRKRVDYDHLPDWDACVQHLVREAARSSTGKAFDSFKPIITKKKASGGKRDDKERDDDSDDEKSKKKRDKEKEDPLCAGIDMKVISEAKWFKRYKFLARENKRDYEQHGNSDSWKTRYIYMSDSIDRKTQRCSRCKGRGHVGSACKDPLPEVLWPGMAPSEEPSGRRREHSPDRRDDYRDRREPSRDRREPSRERQYSGRDSYRDGSRERGEYQRREPSTSYQARGGQDARARSPYQGRARSPSTGGPIICYRCDREGHKSSECRHDTMSDGKPIQSSGRGQSPSSRGGGYAGGGRGEGRGAHSADA